MYLCFKCNFKILNFYISNFFKIFFISFENVLLYGTLLNS